MLFLKATSITSMPQGGKVHTVFSSLRILSDTDIPACPDCMLFFLMWTLSDNHFPVFKVLPSHPIYPCDSNTANFLILEIYYYLVPQVVFPSVKKILILGLKAY